MSIKNPKEANCRPFGLHFVMGLDNVKYYAHSIFIVISYDSLVCVGCIRLNYTIVVYGWPRYFVIFKLNSNWVKHLRVFPKNYQPNIHKLYVVFVSFFSDVY